MITRFQVAELLIVMAVTKVSLADKTQTYLYDEHGDLVEVKTTSPSETTVLKRTGGVWVESLLHSRSGEYHEVWRDQCERKVSPEGGLIVANDFLAGAYTHELLSDGVDTVKPMVPGI